MHNTRSRNSDIIRRDSYLINAHLENSTHRRRTWPLNQDAVPPLSPSTRRNTIDGLKSSRELQSSERSTPSWFRTMCKSLRLLSTEPSSTNQNAGRGPCNPSRAGDVSPELESYRSSIAMNHELDNPSDPALALFRLYFGEDLVEKFRGRYLERESDLMMRTFIAVSQPLALLREEVYSKAVSQEEKRLDLGWVKKAGKHLVRWTTGSGLWSWMRAQQRKLKDTDDKQLARAEIYRMSFPDADWNYGYTVEPTFYRCLHKHIYDLRRGVAKTNRLVDDQLRWCFRADYLVANIVRLRQGFRESCIVFSFQKWKMIGSNGVRQARMRACHDLQELICGTTAIFPKSAMWSEHDERESHETSVRLALRAVRFLSARIVDAMIPRDEWRLVLMEMQALVDRLQDSHRNSLICEVRDLL